MATVYIRQRRDGLENARGIGIERECNLGADGQTPESVDASRMMPLVLRTAAGDAATCPV